MSAADRPPRGAATTSGAGAPTPTRAVVFDLDGTLSRSMDQHHRAYLKVLEPLGLTPAFLDICLLEGKRSGEVVRLLLDRAGKAITTERAMELGAEKQRVFRSLGVPTLYPGALAALTRLREAGFTLGLATGTSRANVRHMLGDGADLFATVVPGEEVKNTKPDPESYLRAFAELKADPRDGFVVENAPLGVDAGKKSGARVVAVTHTLPPPYLWEADAVVPSLDEAVAWIEKEGKRS